MKEIFKNDLIEKFTQYNTEYTNGYTWWQYVNAESDLDTALAFAKFYCPDIVIVDGYFLLKDKFDEKIFENWKKECKCKKDVEIMMNMYSAEDFFHITEEDTENYLEKSIVLWNVLKFFWEMSFKARFPERNIVVDIFEEWDEHIITVYEEAVENGR